MVAKRPNWLVLVAAACWLCASGARAQDQDPSAWSETAARGAFDLCRADAPDAAAVADHGEVWGWPHFVPYLEHPDGYSREAGGESRRELVVGDKTAYVEITVQSGQVTSAAPADVRYFRCNVTANQPIDAGLEAYFSALYGPPASRTDKATVWLAGAAAGAAPDDDAMALKPVAAGGVGAQGLRIELSRELGRDNAKLTIYQRVAPP